MYRAIALLTTTALFTAACAPPVAPARDVTALASPTPRAATPAPAHLAVEVADTTAPAVAPTPAPAAQDPAASQPAASATTEGSGSSPSDEAHGSDAMPRTIGWFSVGFGVASGAVAIGTSVMMLNDASTRSNDCNAAKQCSSAGLNANTQLGQLGAWNAVTYATAALGIGIGAFLLITNPANGEKQTALGVTPNGVLLRGTF
jgi:hypothetical protein